MRSKRGGPHQFGAGLLLIGMSIEKCPASCQGRLRLVARNGSAAIIEHPTLRKVSFTGSTPVGQQLLTQVARGVLRTSMELGHLQTKYTLTVNPFL